MDDAPPRLTPPRAAPAPPAAPSRPGATVASVAALGLGLVATAALLLLAFATALCGLFGETCTEGEQRRIGLALVGAGATFVGVPLLVAIARRDARWLLAPVVEAGVVVALVVLNDVL